MEEFTVGSTRPLKASAVSQRDADGNIEISLADRAKIKPAAWVEHLENLIAIIKRENPQDF